MATAHTMLIFAAAACFFVGAIGLNTGRASAISLGLFFWILADYFTH